MVAVAVCTLGVMVLGVVRSGLPGSSARTRDGRGRLAEKLTAERIGPGGGVGLHRATEHGGSRSGPSGLPARPRAAGSAGKQEHAQAHEPEQGIDAAARAAGVVRGGGPR